MASRYDMWKLSSPPDLDAPELCGLCCEARATAAEREIDGRWQGVCETCAEKLDREAHASLGHAIGRALALPGGARLLEAIGAAMGRAR